MKKRISFFVSLFALAVMVALVLPGSSSSAQTPAATMAATAAALPTSLPDVKLDGATFTVGSKDFSEQLILAQITEQVLTAKGAKVNDKSNIKGSVNTRTALTSGDIDMYWEYTGTAWITYLKETKPIADQKEQYQAVADR